MLKQCAVAVVAVTCLTSHAACAAEWATREEATAMVGKAVQAIKTEGTEKIYAAVIAKDPRFVDRDCYVVVYGLDGKVLAHGANSKLVGVDMLDTQDVDGKSFVKERVELAKSKGTFWQDYKFVNPISKKVEPKQAYCERVGETAVCAGVYKF